MQNRLHLLWPCGQGSASDPEATKHMAGQTLHKHLHTCSCRQGARVPIATLLCRPRHLNRLCTSPTPLGGVALAPNTQRGPNPVLVARLGAVGLAPSASGGLPGRQQGKAIAGTETRRTGRNTDCGGGAGTTDSGWNYRAAAAAASASAQNVD